MKQTIPSVFLLLLFFTFPLGAIQVVKTDSPRDTMRTFIEAMNDYRKGVTEGDAALRSRLRDAVETLNLSSYSTLVRREAGERAAIFLKEVIDRVIVIDFEKIPASVGDSKNPLLRWRLRGTEIAIARMESGERAGEYLFTTGTVQRARYFFDQVKEKPFVEGSGKGAAYTPPWTEQFLPAGWGEAKTFGLHNWQWFAIFAAIFAGLLLKFFIEVFIEFLKKTFVKDESDWFGRIIHAIEKPVGLIVSTAFWFLALQWLDLEGFALSVFTAFIKAILSFAIVWLAYSMSYVLSDYLKKLAMRSDVYFDDQLVPLITRAVRMFIVIMGVLVGLQNLGVNVASVLAGLGLGGLAFALAAKDTAANLFGSIMILWDRPFRVGDWIVSGDQEGTVEEIGFRSTRIRTFYNSQLSIPNSVLANANIDNMGRRIYRRIKTNLGLTYDTPPEKVEAFVEGVKDLIQKHEYTRKDYYHVVFSGYGASSLDILLYCFLQVPDWGTELKERQNLYLSILKLAKSLDVSFAFPSQSLYVESWPEGSIPLADR